MSDGWRRQALRAWEAIDSLRAENERLRALCGMLGDRLALASEALSRAAERGRLCAGCGAELTKEGDS
jgi:hypothetical protein